MPFMNLGIRKKKKLGLCEPRQLSPFNNVLLPLNEKGEIDLGLCDIYIS